MRQSAWLTTIKPAGTLVDSTARSKTSERSGFSSVWTSSQKATESRIAQVARPSSKPPRSGMGLGLAAASEDATHQRELSRLTLFPGRAGASLLRFAEWMHGRVSRPGRAREPGR